MSYTIAPACKALLTQSTVRYPNRDRSYDGIIGDQAHAARRSWHNPSNEDGTPNPDGWVTAVDLTHDPEHGCDAHSLVRRLVANADPRIREAISNGRIWTAARADEGWRYYGGSNPHQHHCHITVAWRYRTSTAAWWPTVAPSNVTTPAPTVQEDDMAAAVLLKAPDKGAVYATDGMRRWYVPTPTVRDELRATGIYGDGTVHTVSQATLDAIPMVTP